MPNIVMDEWSDMVFLKPNGASFSATKYPKLAKIWTGLIIPDMRGEFPRIWDDGRGVDAGRALLSAQGDATRNITGGATSSNYSGWLANGELKDTDGKGAIKINSVGPRVYASATTTGGVSTNWFFWDFSSDRVVPTAAENRPRSIALNFLVRAK